MANIDLKLSSKEDKVTHRSEILIRFYQGQKIDYRVKSGLFVEPRHFRYFVNRNASKKQGVVVPDKRVCHKSVTHPFLFFAFSQIRNL